MIESEMAGTAQYFHVPLLEMKAMKIKKTIP
jgi:hypothetical protein